jgi:hypothetical protein
MVLMEVPSRKLQGCASHPRGQSSWLEGRHQVGRVGGSDHLIGVDICLGRRMHFVRITRSDIMGVAGLRKKEGP